MWSEARLQTGENWRGREGIRIQEGVYRTTLSPTLPPHLAEQGEGDVVLGAAEGLDVRLAARLLLTNCSMK